MKKYALLSILLIFCVFQSYGQKLRDVVYLKNGSIIYGTLVEISEGKYKIKGSDGSLFIYTTDEVEKYEKQLPAFNGRKSSGMAFALEAGLLVGAQSNEYAAPFSFNAVAGYNINKNNMIGIGSGAEFLGKTFAPLFAEYRFTVQDKKFSPYLFARGGMLIHLGGDDSNYYDYYPQYYMRKEYNGGLSVALGTGLSWAGEEMETYLSFAYRYAKTSYLQTEYNQADVTYTNIYNRLEVKIGFRF